MTNAMEWAVLVCAGWVVIAGLILLFWHATEPRDAKHLAGKGEEIERVWLNDDELYDAVWRQENMKFDVARESWARLHNSLELAISADKKTGAGPLFTTSKTKLVSTALELLACDEQSLCDIENVASWLEVHPGKANITKLGAL